MTRVIRRQRSLPDILRSKHGRPTHRPRQILHSLRHHHSSLRHSANPTRQALHNTTSSTWLLKTCCLTVQSIKLLRSPRFSLICDLYKKHARIENHAGTRERCSTRAGGVVKCSNMSSLHISTMGELLKLNSVPVEHPTMVPVCPA